MRRFFFCSKVVSSTTFRSCEARTDLSELFFAAGKAKAKKAGTLRQAQDKLRADKGAQIILP